MLDIISNKIKEIENHLFKVSSCYISYTIDLEKIKLLKELKQCIK